MANIIVERKTRQLIISKNFSNKAKLYGSDEYKELNAAQNDFPTYKIVVRHTKSKTPNKGLTYGFMETYIKNHGNEADAAAFKKITEKNSESLAEKVPYKKVKDWFVNKYPEATMLNPEISKLLEKAA